MARAPIEVGIASETKAFKQGIETGVVRPLEDAVEALDELGKNRGPDELERSMEDAQDATKALGREVNRVAEGIERDFRQSYKSVARDADDASRKAKDAMAETKGEALQNASEMIGSFDGSVTAFADAAQGTLGGLSAGLAGISPAAAVGAAGAGLAIGLVGEALGAQAQQAEANKQALIDMYRAAAEEGRTFLDSAQITSAAFDVMFNPDRASEWAGIQKEAKTLGLDAQTVLLASVGSAKDLAVVMEQANAKQDEWNKKIADPTPTVKRQALASAEKQAVDAIVDRYEAVARTIDESTQKAKDAQDIKDSLAERDRAQIARTREADQQRYEGIARAQAQIPTEIVTKVRVDTSEVDKLAATLQGKRLQAYVDLYERRTGKPLP